MILPTHFEAFRHPPARHGLSCERAGLKQDRCVYANPVSRIKAGALAMVTGQKNKPKPGVTFDRVWAFLNIKAVLALKAPLNNHLRINCLCLIFSKKIIFFKKKYLRHDRSHSGLSDTN